MRKVSIPVPDGAGEPEGAPLPCLNSNISIEVGSETPLQPLGVVASRSIDPPRQPPPKWALSEVEKDAFRKVRELSTQHRKSAFVLKSSVEKLAADHGVEFLGFLTLTFAEHITCPREAQKRLNSLLSNVIKVRYREYVGVMERQKSGRIHYHLLVVLSCDIRTGFDWVQLQQGNYSSAGPELRQEWSFWRRTAKAYRFGRTELLPVKSDIEAMAKYVGKYIGKAIEARNPDDKGVRLVRYSRGARAGTTRFQFHSEGSVEWRRKVATFAVLVQRRYPDERIAGLKDLSRVLGKRWAYHHRETIRSLP